jgi:DNA-binding GntR family transcriptional regulator
VWSTPLGLAVYTRTAPSTARTLADASEHEAIADAIAAHDGGRAEALMHEHIDAARRVFLERL